jgi:CHAD domain-containing protein
VEGLFEKANPVDLDSGMANAVAFRIIARNCLRQIIANAPGVCVCEVEAVHQMRVGLRRLRAAIAIFGKMVADRERDRIKDELKWITGELGPARDLDVLAEDVSKKKCRTEGQGVAEAERAVAEKRGEAYAAAITSVRSDRFRALLLDVAEWIEVGPWTTDAEVAARRERAVSEHAAKWLATTRKKIRARGEDLRRLDADKRHKLRIRAKNLRYAIEFFTSIRPDADKAKRREAALAALKDLQDHLGALNDIAARAALVAGGDELAGHAAILLAAKDDDVDRLLDRAQSAHSRFAEVKSFWD